MPVYEQLQLWAWKDSLDLGYELKGSLNLAPPITGEYAFREMSRYWIPPPPRPYGEGVGVGALAARTRSEAAGLPVRRAPPPTPPRQNGEGRAAELKWPRFSFAASRSLS